MVTCRRCSSVLPEYAKFCEYCGCMLREQGNVQTVLLDSNRTALFEHPPGEIDDAQGLWDPISDIDFSVVPLGEESQLSKDTFLPNPNFIPLADKEDQQPKTLVLDSFPGIPGPSEGEPLSVSHDQAFFSLHAAPSSEDEVD